MRLDKFLADMKIGSRKEVKQYIKDRRVTVNGETVTDAAYKVDETSIVCLDDEMITYINYEYYLLNKPAGVLCTLDNSPNVLDLIDSRRKGLFPVGRLDKETEGLILVTNDGQMAHRLISPRQQIDKEYFVEVDRELPENAKSILENGISFKEFTSDPAIYKQLDSTHAILIIHEGKYHQVRRMFEHLGCKVLYLQRRKFAFLNLKGLDVGEYRELSEEEILKLKEY